MNNDEIINLLSNLKHRIFPRSFERLAISGKDLVGVEVGVYKAYHAKSLLDNLDIKKLYLVDPYEVYEDYNEKKFINGVNNDPPDISKIEAQNRLSQYKNKLHWIFKKTSDISDEIPSNLDFVYIDGNHSENFVKTDILHFFSKIRPGGVIGGHDFYNGYCREHDGVIQAVIKFSVQNKLSLQVEFPDWWIRKEI